LNNRVIKVLPLVCALALTGCAIDIQVKSDYDGILGSGLAISTVTGAPISASQLSDAVVGVVPNAFFEKDYQATVKTMQEPKKTASVLGILGGLLSIAASGKGISTAQLDQSNSQLQQTENARVAAWTSAQDEVSRDALMTMFKQVVQQHAKEVEEYKTLGQARQAEVNFIAVVGVKAAGESPTIELFTPKLERILLVSGTSSATEPGDKVKQQFVDLTRNLKEALR
jgi:hypothetical protein